jgi:hypothetical protein
LGLDLMKYRRHGFEEARAEALQIAEAFVASEARECSRWVTQCGQPEPDQAAPGFDRRKSIVAWKVWTKSIPADGGTFDGGDGCVLVDVETKQARWEEWP